MQTNKMKICDLCHLLLIHTADLRGQHYLAFRWSQHRFTSGLLVSGRRDIPGDSRDTQLRRMQQRSKFKVVKMLMVVVVVFTLSWLPLYTFWLLVKFVDLGTLPAFVGHLLPVAMPVAQWLGASNSCVNPVLYAFFNHKYRQGFQKLLQSGSCCSIVRIETPTDSTMRRSAHCNTLHTTVSQADLSPAALAVLKVTQKANSRQAWRDRTKRAATARRTSKFPAV